MTTGGDEFGISGHPLLQRIGEEAMTATPVQNHRLNEHGNSTFFDLYSGDWGILGQGSDHTVFAFYLGISALDLGFGGETAFASYHSMYDTNGWQEVVDPDWMLAEDIARFTGILAMKLLDSKVIPFDLGILAMTMKQWFTQNLMDAVIDYDCDPDAFFAENVTHSLLASIEEFEAIAIALNEDIVDVANRTDSDDDDVDEDDLELVDRYNELLGSMASQLMHPQGLPQRIWHKNILWNTAMEDGPPNVFPYIWYALQYECEEEMLREAFNVTQSVIDEATITLQVYAGNNTQSLF